MMAPLIDVVFQLLAFFLLTWNYLRLPTLDVNLPESSTSLISRSSFTLVISVHSNGTYSLEGETLTAEQLAGVLEERVGASSEPISAEVLSDRIAPVQSLISLLDILRRLKIQNISLASLPPEKK